MRNPVEFPGLGRVAPVLDDETRTLLLAMKQIIETLLGVRGSDNLDRAVKYRDLVELGLITESEVPRK